MRASHGGKFSAVMLHQLGRASTLIMHVKGPWVVFDEGTNWCSLSLRGNPSEAVRMEKVPRCSSKSWVQTPPSSSVPVRLIVGRRESCALCDTTGANSARQEVCRCAGAWLMATRGGAMCLLHTWRRRQQQQKLVDVGLRCLSSGGGAPRTAFLHCLTPGEAQLFPKLVGTGEPPHHRKLH